MIHCRSNDRKAYRTAQGNDPAKRARLDLHVRQGPPDFPVYSPVAWGAPDKVRVEEVLLVRLRRMDEPVRDGA